MVMLTALAMPVIGSACSCIWSDGCLIPYSAKSAMFLGKVLSVRDAAPLPNRDEPRRLATVQVEESFSGIPDDMKRVEVWTGTSSCGIPFQRGQSYLISGGVGADGSVGTGFCNGTRPAEYAAAALKVLRLRQAGKAIPSLVGRIELQVPSFQGRESAPNPTPLRDTIVRAKVDGRTFETRSDGEGIYEFYDLPGGNVEFDPDLPPGTQLSWFIGSDRPLSPRPIVAGRCTERNIEVFPRGSIEGRVLDSTGNVIPEAFVYILPVGQTMPKDRRKLLWESQTRQDYFRFVHLPPGEYVVFVNPEQARNPKFPYRRTFYPNVMEMSLAKRIRVGLGEHVKGIDMRLVEAFATRSITVRVTWADGRPLEGFVMVRAKSEGDPSAEGVVERGKAILHRDEPYGLTAEYVCQYRDSNGFGPGATVRSSVVRSSPQDGKAEYVLVLNANGCPQVEGKVLMEGR
ncbi:hypothetical protein F183_A34350 [Bryobacterales bacterium F-183]|nr:hypothetical protein F183_A34350 [Bryobacterales bacterium F-183]